VLILLHRINWLARENIRITRTRSVSEARFTRPVTKSDQNELSARGIQYVTPGTCLSIAADANLQADLSDPFVPFRGIVNWVQDRRALFWAGISASPSRRLQASSDGRPLTGDLRSVACPPRGKAGNMRRSRTGGRSRALPTGGRRSDMSNGRCRD
jgi:hypothetical protein